MKWIRPKLLTAAITGVSVLALAAPVASQASFEAPFNVQCSGRPTTGRGTRLQYQLASEWSSAFYSSGSTLGCKGTGTSTIETVTGTTPTALEAFGAANGVRNPSYRLLDVEEPPTLSQWSNIDLGDKPDEDSGLVRQIPVTSTAIVPLVNFPTGCSIPTKEATPDGRFTVSNAALEQAYAGKIATWGALLPNISSSCASLPIERVVPEGSEGSTFAFKQWLAKVDPALGWEESASLPNEAWPNDTGATATVRSKRGEGGEANAIIATSGSIGFASLPVAREYEFGNFSPSNPQHSSGNSTFWLSVVNGSGARTEPTRDPHSGTDNVLGANCDNPTYNYTPAGYDTTVTPIWRYVSAAGSKTGWPICTLSYDLAWDDAATVYGKSEENEAQQRTVKDYLAYVLGPEGQLEAKVSDYSPLSAAILADAKDGQSRVGWNKTAGSRSNSIKSEIAAARAHSKP